MNRPTFLHVSSDRKRIIKLALDARTVGEAKAVNDLIAKEIGAEHWRPIGDRANNHGLMGGIPQQLISWRN